MEQDAPNLLESYHLLSFDVIDSTNAEAKRHAENGGTHGAVIWAHQQTEGKGRMGREWVSPEGNLYVSLLLQPRCDLAQRTQLAFLTAVALAETLDSILGEEADLRCKWPNDVLLEGKKLAGILLENFQTTNEFGRTQEWMIIGMGLNVMDHPESGTRYPATSLKAAGIELISAKIVLSRFIYNFILRYDAWQEEGFAPIKKAWQALAYGLNQRVSVEVADKQVEGIYRGIDANGALLLDVEGKQIALSAGDVSFPELVKG